MRRKLIKQGHSTLTVTLPIDWIKDLNLKAGNEVEILKKNKELVISAEKKNEKTSVAIDIEGLDIPLIWKYFMAAYREGYDEIKVKFNPKDRYDSPYKFVTQHKFDQKYDKQPKHTPLELIQRITNRFIGLELIEQYRDYCIVRGMTEISSKEFDNSLRRVFLVVMQMCEELEEAVKKNDHSLLEHTHDIDINLDKFQDYCIWVLNKTGFKETKKSSLMFSLLYLLEILGDEFKNISHHITMDLKGKSLKNLLKLTEITVEQFKKFYELYYSFDRKKLIELSKRDREIYSFLPQFYKKHLGKGKSTLTDDELEIFNHLRRIGRYINSLVELRVEMEF